MNTLLLTLFKIAEVAAIVAILRFVIVYSRLEPWWRNPIGRSIVYKDIALMLALLPALLSLFLDLNRLTSQIIGWFDLACITAIAVLMFWRTEVWKRTARRSAAERDVSG